MIDGASRPIPCTCGRGDRLPGQWGCAACLRERERQDSALRAERDEELFYRRLEREMNLPTRFQAGFSLDDVWRPTPALKAVWTFRDEDNEDTVLVLAGPTGTGKTHAAAAWAVSYAVHRLAPYWFDVPHLLRGLQNFDTQAALLTRAAEHRRVVFDDLGAGYRKDGGMVESLMEEILCTRLDEG